MIIDIAQKYLATILEIIEQDPSSDVAQIAENTLPRTPLLDWQVEAIFHQLGYTLQNQFELPNDNAIKEFIRVFPYSKVLNAHEEGSQAEINIELTDLQRELTEEYLEPNLHLISEEAHQSLELQGLEATHAELLTNELGENELEVTVQDNQGNQSIQSFPYVEPESSLLTSTASTQQSTEQTAVTAEEAISSQQVDTSILEAEQLSLEQQLGTQESIETQLEQPGVSPELQRFDEIQRIEAETESVEQNQAQLKAQEEQRLQQLEAQARIKTRQRQQADQKNQQTSGMRPGTKKILAAAVAGNAVVGGGLLSIILGGDLIGLFS